MRCSIVARDFVVDLRCSDRCDCDALRSTLACTPVWGRLAQRASDRHDFDFERAHALAHMARRGKVSADPALRHLTFSFGAAQI